MSRSWAPSLFCIALLAGCGGGSSPAPSTTSSTPAPAPAPGTGTSSSPTSDPVVVSVSAGQQLSGVDIAVSSPANASGANAEMLGVSDLNSGGSATNTGATAHRGTTMKVIMFGRGLNGSQQISVLGPKDVSVSNVRGITSTSGTPGVAFDIAVAGNAALGARTVLLKDPNGDITTFTGGLEIVQ
jgi:hypothetical protein